MTSYKKMQTKYQKQNIEPSQLLFVGFHPAILFIYSFIVEQITKKSVATVIPVILSNCTFKCAKSVTL